MYYKNKIIFMYPARSCPCHYSVTMVTTLTVAFIFFVFIIYIIRSVNKLSVQDVRKEKEIGDFIGLNNCSGDARVQFVERRNLLFFRTFRNM